MITGLVCITPGAGVVQPWAAVLMGVMSGSIPWYTMMVLHKKSAFFQRVDDTLGVFHTHVVAGVLGGILSGLFAEPNLLEMLYGEDKRGHHGLKQIKYQVLGAAFIRVSQHRFDLSLACSSRREKKKACSRLSKLTEHEQMFNSLDFFSEFKIQTEICCQT